jgi:AcrR family transcriptional regulator
MNGLADFSLRRAARAAGTTHKVLLYHFSDVDDLLVQAVTRLRERRIAKGAVALASAGDSTLAQRVRALWPVLVADEGLVLDQSIGLAMYDPARYAALGHEASRQYLPTLLALCPAAWDDARKLEVAHFVLGTLRGFLVDARTTGDDAGVRAGFTALDRALDREEHGQPSS